MGEKRAEEPMAILHWDFHSPYNKVQIKGSHTMRSLSDAQKLRDHMIADFGDGSHWVETLNHTWDEYISGIPALKDQS